MAVEVYYTWLLMSAVEINNVTNVEFKKILIRFSAGSTSALYIIYNPLHFSRGIQQYFFTFRRDFYVAITTEILFSSAFVNNSAGKKRLCY